MNLLSFISLIAFFIFLFTGIYVFLDDYRSKLHQWFLLFSISFAIYSLSYTFLYFAATRDFAMTWFKVSSIGWTLFPPLLLNIAFSLTGYHTKLNRWTIQPLIFLPGVVFILRSIFYKLYVHEFIWNGYYWKFVPDFSSAWLWTYLVYLTTYVAASFILILRWRNATTLNKHRIMGGIILWVLGIAYFFSMSSNMLLPYLGIHKLPEFAHLACSVVIIGFGFALVKYRHISVKPETTGETLFPVLNDMLFLTDNNLVILHINKALKDATGFYAAELRGKPLREFADWPNGWPDSGRPGMDTPDETVTNINLRTKNGDLLPVMMTGKAVLDDYNDLTGYVFVATNISAEVRLRNEIEERRELQYELTKAREQAGESDRLKSTFLSNISHELRTPLNGILGFTEILKLELNDTSFSEIADHIDRSGNRLLGTLNSIIDLSLIETNKNEIDKQPVNLSDLIKSKASLYKNYAESKNLYLEIKINESRIMSRTDQRLLGHVLSNLLDNGIKYTDSGGLEVSCRQVSSGNRYWALIKVQDTGIGISKEDFSKIFERFRQSSEGQNQAYEGMGIGLSICKHFVELLDGEIWVESKEGEGSSFFVKIPSYFTEKTIKEESETDEVAETNDTEDHAGKVRPCLLVVEDERSNREYMKYILSEFYEVDVTESGIRALEMAGKNRYDAIFMDVNLNREMTGMEAVKKIRAIKNYSDCAITAVTADVLKNIQGHLLQSGFTHYLPKPFTRNQLLKITQEMLGKK